MIMPFQTFSTLLDDCFVACKKQGYQSISIPVIGVGRMLKFPLDAITTVMVDEAMQEATTSTSLKVFKRFVFICYTVYTSNNC